MVNNIGKIENQNIENQNNKEPILFDTKNPDIKILLFGKNKTILYAVIDESKAGNIDYSKYTLRDQFDNTLKLHGKNYKIISILSNENFDDGIYSSNDHLAMETIDEFKGQGLNKHMFNIKESIDGILSRSVEKIVSNIFILLKNGYKVVGKIDKNDGIEKKFNGQKFIEKIIALKMKNGDFEGRLDSTYVFKKENN